MTNQSCSCPVSTLSISPSTRDVDQGDSNYWTFAVSNPTQNAIYFHVDWGDGTSSTSTATACNTSVSLGKTYNYAGDFSITATAKTSSSGSVIDTDTASVTVDRSFNFDECNEWFRANAGGYGGSSDTWTIPTPTVPAGTPIDFRYQAYNVPDRFKVSYNGSVVYDSGYRGSSSYLQALRDALDDQTVTIDGTGAGEELGIFETVSGVNTFTVTVFGPLSGTAWNYDIRADCP
jgi:hypothetical protein